MINLALQEARLFKAQENLYVDKNLTRKLNNDSLQNKNIFSEKWDKLKEVANDDNEEGWKSFQFEWFLKLYGFKSEKEIQNYLDTLSERPALLDAGCGKGYKTAWLSLLNKNGSVLGIDFSTSVHKAAERYSSNKYNLQFVQADIASMPIADSTQDLILCDQVLHHTENPEQTAKEFYRILKPGGKLLTYVYRRKALPRELLDDYFRNAVHELNNDQLWEIAAGMTKIGKLLSENDIQLDFPDIKSLNIKGGKQSLQRFLYWNFFKCFWNKDFGYEASLSTNYDWYSPSIAHRYSKDEFLALMQDSGFETEFVHEEEACFSGRFTKTVG